MPRFTSPEAKEKWMASMRATRAAKKGLQKPDEKVSDKVAVRASSNGGGIAGAIEEIDSKIAALENVKKHLRHAQELVNL